MGCARDSVNFVGFVVVLPCLTSLLQVGSLEVQETVFIFLRSPRIKCRSRKCPTPLYGKKIGKKRSYR